jgi:hypothetical protein
MTRQDALARALDAGGFAMLLVATWAFWHGWEHRELLLIAAGALGVAGIRARIHADRSRAGPVPDRMVE